MSDNFVKFVILQGGEHSIHIVFPNQSIPCHFRQIISKAVCRKVTYLHDVLTHLLTYLLTYLLSVALFNGNVVFTQNLEVLS